jgi:ribosomal protein L18E
MPLIRRLPKRGFNNAAFDKSYAIVNLDDLNSFKAGSIINEQVLRESNLIRGQFVGIKILGDGELKHSLRVEADKVSAAAREKIEKAGGTITLREEGAPKADMIHVAGETGISAGEESAESVLQAAGKKKSSRRAQAKVKSRAKKKTSQER